MDKSEESQMRRILTVWAERVARSEGRPLNKNDEAVVDHTLEEIARGAYSALAEFCEDRLKE